MMEMALAKDNHVINTLPPDRPDTDFSLAACRSGWFAATSHAFLAERFPLLPVKLLRVGLL